jgi:hypothetical protein
MEWGSSLIDSATPLTQPDREAIMSGFVVEKARSPNRFCEI